MGGFAWAKSLGVGAPLWVTKCDPSSVTKFTELPLSTVTVDSHSVAEVPKT